MPAAHEYTEEDRERVRAILSNPMGFPEAFKKWLPEWLAQNMPVIPVGQLSGYNQRRGDFNEIIDDAGTTYGPGLDNDWGTMVTTHPTITKLANASYLVIWGGFFAGGDQGSDGDIGISINGSTPDANLAASATDLLDDGYYVMRAHIFDVSSASGVNTLEAKVKLRDTGGGSATITVGSRYMITLRAN